MERSRILIVEDNADTRRFLEAMLSKDFEIITAENGVIGIDFARTKAPDLILMDIMLPILSGYDACSLLRKDERTKRIPILFLSAKNSIADVTQGLAAGADDYIPKPFDFKELKARIENRIRKRKEEVDVPIQVGSLSLNSSTRQASYGNKTVQLTVTEFDILRCLVVKAGEIVSRDDILKDVWRDEAGATNDRTIDVHVRALRKKIPALTRHVQSVYGVGYRFNKLGE